MTSEIQNRAQFDIIRYAQCWEDADILIEGLNIKEGATCLSIASAGDNALALLTKNPAKVIALDLSQAQLECVALRVAAYRHLRHGELLQLMGSRPCNNRKILFDKCLPSLNPASIDFWQMRMADVEKHGIAGVGKFERYFRTFKKYVLPLVHSRKTVESLLSDKLETERAEFFDNVWNSVRWKLMLKIFFSRTVMGRHGRDPAFFDYVQGSVSDHVVRRAEFGMKTLNPAFNPYLQWIMTETHRTALPCALREENFDVIRDNLGRIEWRQQSVEEFVSSGEKADAYNLSDIFEYMSEEFYSDLYKKLYDSANPGARFVYWNMMVPRSVPYTLKGKVVSKPGLSETLFKQDKAFFYSRFIVEEKV